MIVREDWLDHLTCNLSDASSRSVLMRERFWLVNAMLSTNESMLAVLWKWLK